MARNERGAGLQTPFLKAVDWLAVYRVVNGVIVETRLLSAIEGNDQVDRDAAGG